MATRAFKPTTRAAFNQGAMPFIACFNRAETPLGIDLDKLIAALQVYVDKHVAPVWNCPARLVKSSGYLKGHWALVFLDDADTEGVLAYHELTPDGLPQAKVFVRTTIANGDLVSVSASHELVEMLVDPAINMMTTGPDPKTMYAYESADPVEALSFPVNGIPMCDFIYPSYFETFRKAGSVKFDHMGKVKRPFQILKAGYQIIFKGGKWSEVFGSAAKAKAFAAEDRRGHRSQARSHGRLARAEPARIAQALKAQQRTKAARATGADARVATRVTTRLRRA